MSSWWGTPPKIIKGDEKMEIATQDMWLTAYACHNNIELKGLREYGDRKLFIFDDTPEFQNIKREYYWNEARVDPLLYKQEIRKLKALTLAD